MTHIPNVTHYGPPEGVFIINYEYGGEIWTIRINITPNLEIEEAFAEAEERIKAIGKTAVPAGMLITSSICTPENEEDVKDFLRQQESLIDEAEKIIKE